MRSGLFRISVALRLLIPILLVGYFWRSVSIVVIHFSENSTSRQDDTATALVLFGDRVDGSALAQQRMTIGRSPEVQRITFATSALDFLAMFQSQRHLCQ